METIFVGITHTHIFFLKSLQMNYIYKQYNNIKSLNRDNMSISCFCCFSLSQMQGVQPYRKDRFLVLSVVVSVNRIHIKMIYWSKSKIIIKNDYYTINKITSPYIIFFWSIILSVFLLTTKKNIKSFHFMNYLA